MLGLNFTNNTNFRPLEVVDRVNDPQLQVAEILIFLLSALRVNIILGTRNKNVFYLGVSSKNESGFRPPLCTYRLNWARRTS